MDNFDNFIDAPTKLIIKFCEDMREVEDDFSNYKGRMSHTWLQEETVFIDYPDTIVMRRRYSCRYIKITVEKTKYPINLYDINFDATKTEDVLTALHDFGYVLDTDWLPVRAEFSHPKLGYLDIHPFVIEEKTVKQANPEGGYWQFPTEFFGTTVFEGRKIPCISLEGQKVFHSGYEPREKDLHDIQILDLIAL
jgi:hypothetical protein